MSMEPKQNRDRDGPAERAVPVLRILGQMQMAVSFLPSLIFGPHGAKRAALCQEVGVPDLCS